MSLLLKEIREARCISRKSNFDRKRFLVNSGFVAIKELEMEINIITKEDLQLLRVQLIDDMKKILEPPNQNKREWLRSGEVKEILNISSGTLQNLRITGKLKATKIGGTYYYKAEEVNKLFKE
jgi:hypothetical protein